MFEWLKDVTGFNSALRVQPVTPESEIIAVDQLEEAVLALSGYSQSSGTFNFNDMWDGEKYNGGYGSTRSSEPNYWLLRMRSREAFTRDLVGNGMIKRLVDNIIGEGLIAEFTPESEIIKKSDDDMDRWTEYVEARQRIWSQSKRSTVPRDISHDAQQSFIAFRALIDGDILIYVQYDENGFLQVGTVDGDAIRTPVTEMPTLLDGHTIQYGVELDKNGGEFAYHIRQEDGTHKRMLRQTPSGRMQARLVRGLARHSNCPRGEPLLGIMLQALKEMDRYRDASLRKAVLNALLVMFIERTESGIGTRPMTGGAKEIINVRNPSNGIVEGQTQRNVTQIPGVVMEDLARGEKPHVHNANTAVEGYREFHDAIIDTFSWVLGCPPTIMKMAFSHNYSASQGEINEFNMVLKNRRGSFSEQYQEDLAKEWLLWQCTTTNTPIKFSNEIFKAYRDDYFLFEAWGNVEFRGIVKQSTELLKMVKAHEQANLNGYMTFDESTRNISGGNFKKNLKRLKREIAELVPIWEVMGRLKPAESAHDDMSETTDDVKEDENVADK